MVPPFLCFLFLSSNKNYGKAIVVLSKKKKQDDMFLQVSQGSLNSPQIFYNLIGRV
jgi:hypothetical protein